MLYEILVRNAVMYSANENDGGLCELPELQILLKCVCTGVREDRRIHHRVFILPFAFFFNLLRERNNAKATPGCFVSFITFCAFGLSSRLSRPPEHVFNSLKEFLQIWHKLSLRLRGELTRIVFQGQCGLTF